jgi:hypothetical protein
LTENKHGDIINSLKGIKMRKIKCGTTLTESGEKFVIRSCEQYDASQENEFTVIYSEDYNNEIHPNSAIDKEGTVVFVNKIFLEKEIDTLTPEEVTEMFKVSY